MIIPLTPHHAPTLARMHGAVDLPWERPWSEQAYEDTLALPTTVALGVFEGDDLLIFLIALKHATSAEILFLMTAPTARRKGYAQQLLKYVLGEPGGFSKNVIPAQAGIQEKLPSDDTLDLDPCFRRNDSGEEDDSVVISKVFLEVCTKNIPAIKLYEMLGFQNMGERKGYYRVPGAPQSFDALTMVWDRV